MSKITAGSTGSLSLPDCLITKRPASRTGPECVMTGEDISSPPSLISIPHYDGDRVHQQDEYHQYHDGGRRESRELVSRQSRPAVDRCREGRVGALQPVRERPT